MNRFIKFSTVILTSATLTSSAGVDPRLSYHWDNCKNADVKIVAAGLWGEVESYVYQPSENCSVYISVDFYDYDTFIKVVELINSTQTTKYYSTNIYGYIIIER